ncbi:5980_t:CDS:2, partial [Racocetra fulgida]
SSISDDNNYDDNYNDDSSALLKESSSCLKLKAKYTGTNNVNINDDIKITYKVNARSQEMT